MRKLSSVVILAVLVVPLVSIRAQERIDQDVYWKIRQEGTSNSQILRTLHVLTDVYGPRLTGSPNLKAAGEWAIKQMHAWGLKNGHLEPWDFGHRRLAQRAPLGAHRLAGEGSAGRRSAGVDAGHERPGARAGDADHAAAAADAGGA